MAGLRYSGPNNSTLFSTCCNVAVCDDKSRCPRCKQEIYPQDARSRHTKALREQLGEKGWREHREHVARQMANDRAFRRRREEEGKSDG